MFYESPREDYEYHTPTFLALLSMFNRSVKPFLRLAQLPRFIPLMFQDERTIPPLCLRFAVTLTHG